jgi:hypothetical protein
MSRHPKLFRYSVGERANRVLVAQRRPGGKFYGRVYDPSLRGGRGDYRWRSLGDQDEEKAKKWAAGEHKKLVEGAEELRSGSVTLARLCAGRMEERGDDAPELPEGEPRDAG